jgi:hypothetical protein
MSLGAAIQQSFPVRVKSNAAYGEKFFRWEQSYGIDPIHPARMADVLDDYIKDAGKIWKKVVTIDMEVRFRDACDIEISCLSYMPDKQDIQLKEPLMTILAKRCSNDTGVCPMMVDKSTPAFSRFGFKRTHPHMFESKHILSLMFTLLAYETRDEAKLVTDGPSIFKRLDSPAGEGGSGN